MPARAVIAAASTATRSVVTCPDDASYDCEVIEKAEPPRPRRRPTGRRDAVAADVARSARRCSERWTTCWWTHCCHDPADGCYRRAGKQFAMYSRASTTASTMRIDLPRMGQPATRAAARRAIAAQPTAAAAQPAASAANAAAVAHRESSPAAAAAASRARREHPPRQRHRRHGSRRARPPRCTAPGRLPMLLAVVALAGLVVCAGLLVGCYLLLCNKRRRGRQKPTLRQRRKYTRQGTELTNGHGGRDEEESEEEEEEEAATTRKPSSRQAEDAAENGEAASPNGKAAHVDAAAAPPLNDILSQISTILPPAQEQNGERSVPDPDRHLVDL